MRKITGAKAITLDSLPNHTDWIPYLLGLKNLSKALDKNVDSITREYGLDKWGVLLHKLQMLNKPTVIDADNILNVERQMPFYAEGNLYLADSMTVQNIYFDLIKNEIQTFVQKHGHLVELGAGYGSIILKLASLPSFNASRYTAGELTDTGVACINLLASEFRNSIEVGLCDLNDLHLEKYTIPNNAVFMTCWTLACLKGFSRSTLNEILRYKPSIVIHIEPTFEHWTDDSLLSMLWKRYFQMNDYNQNYFSALQSYEAEGLIQIVDQRKNLFGCNPLAPISVVKWVPVRK